MTGRQSCRPNPLPRLKEADAFQRLVSEVLYHAASALARLKEADAFQRLVFL